MRGPIAISLILLSFYRRKNSKFVGTEEDIIAELEKLDRAGINVSEVRIRPAPVGSTLDDRHFLGGLLLGGYLSEEKTSFNLNDYGLELVRGTFQKAIDEGCSPEEIIRVAQILEIPEEEYGHILTSAR